MAHVSSTLIELKINCYTFIVSEYHPPLPTGENYLSAAQSAVLTPTHIKLRQCTEPQVMCMITIISLADIIDITESYRCH